jgi:hypothetical protein
VPPWYFFKWWGATQALLTGEGAESHNRIHTDVCLRRNSKGRCLIGQCMQNCGGGNLMERDHLEDTNFDGKIIF